MRINILDLNTECYFAIYKVKELSHYNTILMNDRFEFTLWTGGELINYCNLDDVEDYLNNAYSVYVTELNENTAVLSMIKQGEIEKLVEHDLHSNYYSSIELCRNEDEREKKIPIFNEYKEKILKKNDPFKIAYTLGELYRELNDGEEFEC